MDIPQISEKIRQQIELTEEEVDEMHNSVLDTLQKQVDVLKRTANELTVHHNAVNAYAVTSAGKKRCEHVLESVNAMQKMLGDLDFTGLFASVALMASVDAQCEKWRGETVMKTSADQTTNQPPA